MMEFEIKLRSVRDVQDFVDLSTAYAFPITVQDSQHEISSDSFMELFCLDFSQTLHVVCDCGEAELEALRQDLQRFLVK